MFYVVKDYYDVNFDLVINFECCLEEFVEFINCIYEYGMKVVIDIVLNYVVCNYELVVKFEGVKDFGVDDDMMKIYVCDNNFYYVIG